MIPYGRQHITDDDVDAVVDVLRSDFLTQGPAAPAFEAAMTRLTGASHAVACNSATSALHLACMALELGPGDHLWTTPISFVASANCGLYCGARVSFVDVDPFSSAPDLEHLRLKLEQAARQNELPKVLVVVHLAGHPLDMEAIAGVTAPFGVRIIEDASHAVGAARGGRPVGGCDFSDISVFSFHPVKVITAVEAGVATTLDERLASRMAALRSHGITRDAAEFQFPAPGSWYYEQQHLGLNYRLSDVHAALGRSQLNRLDAYLQRRAEIAARYATELEGVRLVEPAGDARSSWHLAIVHVGDEARRATLFQQLREADVGVNVHYMPIHLQPYYRALGFAPGDYPGAEAFAADILSLPLYPMLRDEEQDRVINLVNRFSAS